MQTEGAVYACCVCGTTGTCGCACPVGRVGCNGCVEWSAAVCVGVNCCGGARFGPYEVCCGGGWACCGWVYWSW